jgi:uncharacterized protein
MWFARPNEFHECEIAPEWDLYRASAGAEIDLPLTSRDDILWAIENKRGSAPKVERGFHQTCADLNPAKQFVVYGGTERFRLNADTEAVGVSELAAQMYSMR